MNIKRNIIFTLESRKKDGLLIVENVPIRMHVNFASQRIEFTTGYRIDMSKWDADKQRVKNGCTNKLKQSALEINVALLGYYTKPQEVFKRFEVAEVMPSPADVKNAFRPKLKDTQKKIIFLTWEELTKLREFEIPPAKQSLDRVRDVFLFQYFTGLRYSDVYNIRRSDIKEDHIEVTTIKTSDSLVIELNKHSKTILEKYQDVVFEHDKALPVITNQKMNEYLKELAELAGINEPIRQTYCKGNERIDEVTPRYALLGTHAGRRTFICNALALGIPPQVVMKWTGHSDYKAMKPYIDIADDIKANAMSKFNQL